MADTYRDKTVEAQRAKALRARVPDSVSKVPTARKTNPQPRSQTSNGKAETSKRHPTTEMEEIRKKINIMCGVSKRVDSSQQLSQVFEQVTKMTQHTLTASASSILLIENDNSDLFFEVADDPLRKQPGRVKISAESGIAGWVVCHGKPLMVNDAAKDQRFNESIDKIAGFEAKSIICAPLVARNKVIGVVEVMNKLDGVNFSEHDLETLMAVAPTVAMAVDNAKLQQNTLDSYKHTVRVLAAAIDVKDPYARGHSQRVSEYSMLGARSLQLSRDERDVIEYAAILHDIGKAYIPAKILLKSGPLNSDEWKVMREHPAVGSNMLKSIPFLEKASKFVRHHHERYDGNGYPDGLKGEAIPVCARLIAVADAFDTMTTNHSYRVSCDADYALERLRRLAGIQFCPAAVQAFVSGFSRFHISHGS